MSHYDYKAAQQILMSDPPFYALIQAAMRKADSDNLNTLRLMFPAVHSELAARYNAPGGFLPGERVAS